MGHILSEAKDLYRWTQTSFIFSSDDSIITSKFLDIRLLIGIMINGIIQVLIIDAKVQHWRFFFFFFWCSLDITQNTQSVGSGGRGSSKDSALGAGVKHPILSCFGCLPLIKSPECLRWDLPCEEMACVRVKWNENHLVLTLSPCKSQSQLLLVYTRCFPLPRAGLL